MRALGMVVLAVQDQKSSLDIVSLVMKAHWVEQAVMLILLLFSAVSWGVIAYKYSQLRRVAKQNAQFLSVFRKSENPSNERYVVFRERMACHLYTNHAEQSCHG